MEECEMKKSKQRFFSAIMALCLGSMSCPLATVSAADTFDTPLAQTDILRRFSYIQSADAVLNSSGDFSASIYCDSSVESIEITVKLQKKGLFGYSTVDTLSDTFYNWYATYEDSFSLDSSETYRIEVTFKVNTADDDESIVRYAYA